jgi:hypothetical protein
VPQGAAGPADDSTPFSFKTNVDSPLYGTRALLNSRMESPEDSNFQIFRDCLSTPLIEKSAEQPVKKTRKARGRKAAIKPIEHEIKESDDAEELSEFIGVCPSSTYRSVLSIDTQSSTLPMRFLPISRPLYKHSHTPPG